MSTAELIHLLDATLPQTQCGLCGHPAGCLPYATAMAEGASADGCVPGGQPVANKLAEILGRAPLPAKPSQWPIVADGRPQRMKAIIREDECIGCTKCISACPVDAIMGSGKLMHSILTDLCTGCELCIPPCPVDCIDLVVDPAPPPSDMERFAEQDDLRRRYQAHVLREQQRMLTQKARKPIVSAAISTEQAAAITGVDVHQLMVPVVDAKPAAPVSAAQTIKLASLRSQIKKLERQLNVKPDDLAKQQQLELLKTALQRSMD
ncbi:RnfABCDGE type electron transport complex subunit B [Alkanindiges illinoisensis]|uniref:RnfABCDGE type electron transport complex subunit B n=1 Tax=Alkanindiges illinoisensis TaxID=197183 RepID=A0A4Y7X941_9GAMM|nr:RnfABCDGE type electron transport complex subunit B [Alkanindiges illinoisensis]TEU23848.1 RnfABCDGE type electron transport complex subunit B [Alkanindiges illinoisensis]